MGSTGIVGQQFVRMLKGHPYFDVVALTASKKSAGKAYEEAVEWVLGGNIPENACNIIVEDVSIESLENKEVKVIFSALPSAVAKEIEAALAHEGYFIFSNASSHRLDTDVPILIPEVNSEHLDMVRHKVDRDRGFIVTNSNCSTAGLVMGLKPLLNFGIKSVFVTTYQALSGAGRHGVESLDILGNVLPYINNEEEKIENETKKIFGQLNGKHLEASDLDVNASCCRVPVKDGHLESIIVEMEEDIDEKAAVCTFSSFRGIPQHLKLPTAPEIPVILRTEENRPQPLLDKDSGTPERAKGMAVTVGRVRKKGNRLNFFLVVHNSIRGGAGTCILNAELALKKGYIR